MKKNNKWFSLVKFAALYAGTLYGVNKLAFYVSTIREIFKSSKHSYYSWKYGNVYYTKMGTGKPLLLLHRPDAACSSYEWENIVNGLAKTHTVYRMDLPGFGRSEKEKMIYTNYMYVQAVLDFIKNVIKEKADIMTSGNASSIAVMAAHCCPEVCGKLLMINPQSMDDMIKPLTSCQKWMRYVMQMPLMGTFIYALSVSKSEIQKMFEKDYYSDSLKIDDNDVHAFCETAHLGGFNARFASMSQLCGYTNTNIVHALKKINQEMYMIGGGDVADIDKTIDVYSHFAPAMRCQKINHTKGMPHMEAPKQTLLICEEFLQD